MKKIISIQLLLAALIFIGFFLFVKFNTIKTNRVEGESYSKTINIQNEYKNKPVPDSLFEVFNDQEIDFTHPKLVFRFSQVYCGTCVTREIRLISKFANKIGWGNIVFLATNRDNEELKRFQKVSGVESPMLNISFDFFEIDKEPLDTPYMFILDSDTIFKELFISTKEIEERTQLYLNRISNYFEQ